MTTEDVALALLKSQIERCILQVDALWFKEQIPVSWDAALQFKLQAAKFNAEMDALAGADLDKAMSVGEAHEEAPVIPTIITQALTQDRIKLWYINRVKGEADATKS